MNLDALPAERALSAAMRKVFAPPAPGDTESSRADALKDAHTQLGILIEKADTQEATMITHENKSPLALTADGTIAKCVDGCRVCGSSGRATVPTHTEAAQDTSQAAHGLRKAADATRALAEAANAQATAALVEVTKLVDDRARKLLVAKASTTYANTPGTPGDVGALLFDLGQADTAGIGKSANGTGLLQRFEAILKAADDALGHGSHSSDAPAAASAAAASSNDAYAQLIGKAHALQDKDPNLTEAQAISKAATLNPGLVRQWQRDQGAGGGNVRI